MDERWRRGEGGYSAQCICGLTFIGVMLMTVTPPKGWRDYLDLSPYLNGYKPCLPCYSSLGIIAPLTNIPLLFPTLSYLCCSPNTLYLFIYFSFTDQIEAY